MNPVPGDNAIPYFSRDREAFGFMSHFHSAPINLDGLDWPTAEHFYQAQKSLEPAYRRAILAASTPVKAKRLAALPTACGRRVRNSWFIKYGQLPRSDWSYVKLQIMRRADLGPDGLGLNWAGRVLMEIRAHLCSR
jgi:predicted NAD-dependent protein-ADP-ribosyltransferase YbiA (DUF1768 family)